MNYVDKPLPVNAHVVWARVTDTPRPSVVQLPSTGRTDNESKCTERDKDFVVVIDIEIGTNEYNYYGYGCFFLF